MRFWAFLKSHRKKVVFLSGLGVLDPPSPLFVEYNRITIGLQIGCGGGGGGGGKIKSVTWRKFELF